MKKLSFLAIFTAICFIGNAQTTPVELRLNLEKGKTYTQTTDVKMNMKMEMQGMKMDSDIPISMTISMKVADIQNDNYVIDCSYDAIKMSMNMMGQSITFDSSNPNTDPSNPFGQLFSSFIGKTFTMILDKRQQVVAIKGIDKLFDSILNNGSYSEEQKAQMNAMLQGILGEDKLKESFTSNNIVFPELPVTEGFTWETESKQNLQGITMLVKNTYKIEKITAATVEISSVSDYKMDMAMGEGETQMKVTMENAIANGTYIIDKQSGWAQSAKLNYDMKMVMTMNQGGKETTVPMQITMEATMQ